MNKLLRIIVIGIILVLLVFLSIGIVKIVPKALNSLANASLSIGSLLDTQGTTGSNTNSNGTASQTNTGTNSTSTGFSIRDLTSGNTKPNYVPSSGSGLPSSAGNTSNSANGSNSGSNHSTISGNTSGVGASNNVGNNYGNNSGSAQSGSNNSQSSNDSTAYTVGATDLAVTVLSKGTINRQTGVYTETNNFTTSDLVAVKFKIENKGQRATGIWSARVDMPSNNASDKMRNLNGNRSLPAGTSVTGEARFDNPITGNQSVIISADTANSNNDINPSNNIATVPISVVGSNIGGNGNNFYNPNTPADLVVRTISIGTVNQFGQYVANVSPRYGEKAAVEFEVTNIGGQTSNSWNWRADVSGAINNTYYASPESVLTPGSASKLIVGFDTNGYYGYGYNQTAYFTITVDSSNNTYESNESNNTANASVNILQY